MHTNMEFITNFVPVPVDIGKGTWGKGKGKSVFTIYQNLSVDTLFRFGRPCKIL